MMFEPAKGSFEGFALPVRGVVEGLAIDGQGNVLFSLGYAGKLGAMNPVTKEFLAFKASLGKSEPNDIAVDRDGNIWFTDISQNTLNKLHGKDLLGLWLK